MSTLQQQIIVSAERQKVIKLLTKDDFELKWFLSNLSIHEKSAFLGLVIGMSPKIEMLCNDQMACESTWVSKYFRPADSFLRALSVDIPINVIATGNIAKSVYVKRYDECVIRCIVSVLLNHLHHHYHHSLSSEKYGVMKTVLIDVIYKAINETNDLFIPGSAKNNIDVSVITNSLIDAICIDYPKETLAMLDGNIVSVVKRVMYQLYCYNDKIFNGQCKELIGQEDADWKKHYLESAYNVFHDTIFPAGSDPGEYSDGLPQKYVDFINTFGDYTWTF